MFFSIIIPTYNREKHILKTLDSVFNQKYSKYEIIVVDNCSTDNTRQLLQPLIDENKIQFIQHDKNYERAKSRNTGMNIAKGDFVTFLDSDDLMYENNLEDAYSFALKSNYKIFHNLYELITPDRVKIKSYSFKKIKNARKEILKGNFLSCIGVFIHKEIYLKYKFDEERELTGTEDHEFWIRIIADYPLVGRINKINSGIVDHSQRTVKNIDVDKGFERQIYILNKINASSHLKLVYKIYLKTFESYIFVYTASNYMATGKNKKSLNFLNLAAKNNLYVVLSSFFQKVLLLTLLKIIKFK